MYPQHSAATGFPCPSITTRAKMSDASAGVDDNQEAVPLRPLSKDMWTCWGRPSNFGFRTLPCRSLCGQLIGKSSCTEVARKFLISSLKTLIGAKVQMHTNALFYVQRRILFENDSDGIMGRRYRKKISWLAEQDLSIQQHYRVSPAIAIHTHSYPSIRYGSIYIT